jgi:S-adenosylmethionine hydrolase
VSATITLTTDFGTRDGYVAEMKGVMLGLAPAVRLVDVTHEIAPHDVMEGALVLEAVAAAFPPGTVHVAVVDPGVGTARRGLVVAAAGQLFVGPDNGVFTPLLAANGWRAFALAAGVYRRAEVSRTFHGRDVFAPAAAHLVLGVPPERFGPAVTDPVRLPWPRPRSTPRSVHGTVVHVDRFGNLITCIDGESTRRLGRPLSVRIGRRRLPLVETYGDLPPRSAGALVGSRNRVEVVVREGSAAATLGAGRGTAVELRGCEGIRGALRLRRGAPSVGGMGGHVGAPDDFSPTSRASKRGAASTTSSKTSRRRATTTRTRKTTSRRST